MELPASPSAESADVATLRGFAKKASATVDLAQEVFDNLERIVRHYDDNEDISAPTITARNTLIRAEGRMINAHQRYEAAMDAHSSFLNARVEATRRLGASDRRGKAAVFCRQGGGACQPQVLEEEAAGTFGGLEGFCR